VNHAKNGRPARACLLALATLLIAAGFAADASAAITDASTATPPLAQFNRETYAYSTTLTTSQEANRYQVMVLQGSDYAQVPLLKAANPNLKILMYSNLLATNPSDPPAWAECTAYAADNASHPSWFLLDNNGHRIPLAGYTGNYVMDVGNTAYQQACVSHATSLAKQYKFDGVYFDGATANLVWAVGSTVTVPKYPSTTTWQPAVYSMLSYAAPQIRAQHLLMVGNIGGGATTTGLWQKWTAVMDGSEEESWMDTSVAYYWPQMIADAAWSEANGKITILHSHYTTETGNTFGLAVMMLQAQGKLSYSTSNANYRNSELWFPEYDLAKALGVALSGSTSLPGGIAARAFANGVVLTNTSASASTVQLVGGNYSGSGLSHVSSIPMSADSGRILLKDTPTGGPNLPPANIVAPAISGAAAVGQTLTANPGLWSALPAPSYRYQWKRCSTQTVCSVISGATGSTYKIQSADASRYLRVAVTATNSAGVRTGSSAPTAKVP
jgi:hypothetical protein